MIKKYHIFFSCTGTLFPIFGHQNPRSGSVFSLKCWIQIRIRTQWIRIRNTIIFHVATKGYWALKKMSLIQTQFFAIVQGWSLPCGRSTRPSRRSPGPRPQECRVDAPGWWGYPTPGSSCGTETEKLFSLECRVDRSGRVRLPDTGLELWNWNKTAVYFGMPRRRSAEWWGIRHRARAVALKQNSWLFWNAA